MQLELPPPFFHQMLEPGCFSSINRALVMSNDSLATAYLDAAARSSFKFCYRKPFNVEFTASKCACQQHVINRLEHTLKPTLGYAKMLFKLFIVKVLQNTCPEYLLLSLRRFHTANKRCCWTQIQRATAFFLWWDLRV